MLRIPVNKDASSSSLTRVESFFEERVTYSSNGSLSAPKQKRLGDNSSTSMSSRAQKIGHDLQQEYNSLFGEDAAQFILDTRERERRELHDLNDRLAAYLERVRLLELQNGSLEQLKARWLSDVANVKSAYEHELSETQRDLDETSRNRAQLESQMDQAQRQFDDLRRKLDDAIRDREAGEAKIEALLRQLEDTERQLANLGRRMQGLEDEVARLRNENNRLHAELQQTKADLDVERMKSVDYENQIQSLLKKMESMRREYEQELSELRNREVAVINADQYKNDLANAIREIRKEFDALAESNRQDLESWYVRKLQDVQVTETNAYRDETKRLMDEVEHLRRKVADLEALNSRLNREIADLDNQMQREKYDYESALEVSESNIKRMLDDNRSLQDKLKMLFETNQNLYAEIAIYRKLLDAEEGRPMNNAVPVKPYISDIDIDPRQQIRSSSPARSNRGFPPAKIPSAYGQPNFQRASKGNITIADISPEGRYIIIENTGNKEESLGDWKLVRVLDNKRELVFSFPKKFNLKGGRTVTVWSRNQGGSNNYVDSFVFDGDSSWGSGNNVLTLLYNKHGEERASLVQTMASSHVSNL